MHSQPAVNRPTKRMSSKFSDHVSLKRQVGSTVFQAFVTNMNHNLRIKYLNSNHKYRISPRAELLLINFCHQTFQVIGMWKGSVDLKESCAHLHKEDMA